MGHESTKFDNGVLITCSDWEGNPQVEGEQRALLRLQRLADTRDARQLEKNHRAARATRGAEGDSESTKIIDEARSEIKEGLGQ